ncbi:hypothetical protein [Cellvibrio sp. OA-2007]|uniref:hypothetical protein n=1 Tax=Cellvibrio sp. OA-2007 TaxID=529823 RepID=UPI0007863765|nr:hypothetical protein [Cellvibrio sp. OA-2007]
MNVTKIIAITLLSIGAASLFYAGMTYTGEADTGAATSLQIRMMQEQKINIPITLGIGCLLFGSLLFTLRNKL